MQNRTPGRTTQNGACKKTLSSRPCMAHITHRCHKREFLLKFPRDRRRWIEWLYQASKRYPGLSVLDYMVTSNHIHLLVYDTGGRNVIPDSIKLIAGRTGKEYNVRKRRKGSFWEDRYHATAVEKNRYLRQCICYIDMNIVRAGVVQHPSEWEFCGYNEIQSPRKRKRIIDFERLIQLLGFENHVELKDAHSKWLTANCRAIPMKRMTSGLRASLWEVKRLLKRLRKPLDIDPEVER